MRTVLIVEDSQDTRELVSRALRLENYNVLEAADGETAIKTLDESEDCPHLVLLDISMPHMTGPEVIKRIRAHDKCPTAKVVVLSGWNDIEKRAQEMGADGWIRKPIQLNEFYSDLDQYF